MSPLNDDQQRRLSTHLRLLISDLDTLADSPELGREAPEFARLDPGVETLRRRLEALADAAALLPGDES
ncbi:MAG: hypothetical protein DMD60_05460 [Gemmatimonadetes bacterium]|nr:MAG: hypothetical protein DMD60_05460 [Gemmatimonadota bacterium]